MAETNTTTMILREKYIEGDIANVMSNSGYSSLFICDDDITIKVMWVNFNHNIAFITSSFFFFINYVFRFSILMNFTF